MKKTITSAGLLALGAATLHAQLTPYAPAPDLTSKELSKPWSIALSVRGFYDDNQYTAHSEPRKDDAFGLEISPSFSLNWTAPQTYLGFSYLYGYRMYDSRPDHDYDQTHQVRARLNHTFSERYKLDVLETFVSAQEPSLVETGTIAGPTTLRSDGDNIHNAASIGFTADLTDQFGLYVSYANNYYDYEDSGHPGSYSALLDRMEHMGTINLRWQARPETIGILGYQYGVNEYRSNDPLDFFSPFVGEDRNSDSHYAYIGGDHTFNSQLQASLRVGAQFISYDEFSSEDSTSPYVDGSLTYSYNPDSYAMVGVRHDRNATDAATVGGGVPVLDQETTTAYLSIKHQIMAKLSCGLIAQAQFSSFQGGLYDGDDEMFFLGGVNLTYSINEFLSADAGYNYDRLSSDLPERSFTRNRVYIGIRASY